jgi:hypothetical protein
VSSINRAADLPAPSDAALRLEYLHDVLGRLWPAPAVAVTGPADGAPAGSEFLVVPGLGRPRLLVPAGSRRAAATAVRRYSEPGSRMARLRLAALGLAMSSGAGPLIMRDRVRILEPGEPGDTIETYLADALGTDVRISLHVGPARANRKPVLQLLSDGGEVLGFAKIGVNDLTRRLVAAETASLRALAGVRLQHTAVPAVLHSGTWQGLEVLVQSPLPIWRKRVPLDAVRLADSMLEIAESAGTRRERLTTSTLWTGLTAALAELSPTPTVESLRNAFAGLTERAGDVEVAFGSWHGDWTPWNMAAVPGRLLVWDWERFSEGVPVGFDALHYELQAAVVRKGADARAAVARCLDRAEALLAPFDVDRGHASAVALAYLVTLAVRYLQDGQAEAGARLGVLGSWLLAELVERVAAL